MLKCVCADVCTYALVFHQLNHTNVVCMLSLNILVDSIDRDEHKNDVIDDVLYAHRIAYYVLVYIFLYNALLLSILLHTRHIHRMCFNEYACFCIEMCVDDEKKEYTSNEEEHVNQIYSIWNMNVNRLRFNCCYCCCCYYFM